MKAIAVLPGKPNSVHLRDVPKPRIEDVPGGRGVLIKILRVGVDGTDKEINAAEYGAGPAAEKRIGQSLASLRPCGTDSRELRIRRRFISNMNFTTRRDFIAISATRWGGLWLGGDPSVLGSLGDVPTAFRLSLLSSCGLVDS